MAVGEITLRGTQEARGRGHLARAWSRLLRKKIALVCMTILLMIYAGGVFANWVAPHGYGYTDQDFKSIRKPPSFEHWAGTDRAGRDMFTRVLWGIQNTMIITFVAMVTGGLVIGVSLGLVSGYFGGKVDAVIMRGGEVFASFPDILLVMILAATLRPRILDWVRSIEDAYNISGLVRSGVADYLVVTLALTAFGWVALARIVRGQVLYLKETQFVEAARAIGVSTPRILFNHLLPNVIGPIVVLVTLGMGALIGTEIILGFLGLGVQPPRPSLGVMLREGANLGALRQEPWMLLAPGAAVWLLLVAWNLLGDALNDVLNPRTR